MDNFSMKRLQKMIDDEVRLSSYTRIANESNLPRSTVWRIGQGRVRDVNLSTAYRIANAIETIKTNRRTSANT